MMCFPVPHYAPQIAAPLSRDKQQSLSKHTVFSRLTVCQMALCSVASSLNRRGGFTPGFIPMHLTGMSDSSDPCGAAPVSVFSLQLSLFSQKSRLLEALSGADVFLVDEQTGEQSLPEHTVCGFVSYTQMCNVFPSMHMHS